MIELALYWYLNHVISIKACNKSKNYVEIQKFVSIGCGRRGRPYPPDGHGHGRPSAMAVGRHHGRNP